MSSGAFWRDDCRYAIGSSECLLIAVPQGFELASAVIPYIEFSWHVEETMRQSCRHAIAGLLGVILFAALALAALRSATEAWGALSLSFAHGVLAVATIGAVCRGPLLLPFRPLGQPLTVAVEAHGNGQGEDLGRKPTPVADPDLAAGEDDLGDIAVTVREGSNLRR